MSADTDLQAAVTKLGTSVSAAVADIQALAAQIATLTNDPVVAAAASQITTLAGNLDAAVNPPAPAPAPTPTP